MIYVLAGNPEQFKNFCHAFDSVGAPGFRYEAQFEELTIGYQMPKQGRVIVLLIGTWHSNPIMESVIAYCNSKDADGRPRGQAFAKFGNAAK